MYPLQQYLRQLDYITMIPTPAGVASMLVLVALCTHLDCNKTNKTFNYLVQYIGLADQAVAVATPSQYGQASALRANPDPRAAAAPVGIAVDVLPFLDCFS